MKTIRQTIFALLIFLCACPAYAVCPEFSNWSTSWTDQFGQTRYTLIAPCKVYIGVPFNITAKVVDTTWHDVKVAYPYSVMDTYSTSTQKYSTRIDPYGSGYDGSGTIYTDASYQWQTVIPLTYTGTPYDHKYTFSFIDNGNGNESFAHHISSSVIGGLTVDPYLITLAQSFSLSQSQQNSKTIPATVFNPSGATLTCRWFEGTDVLQSQTVTSTGSISVALNLATLSPLSVGSHTFTLQVTDGSVTNSANIVVTVSGSSGGGTGEGTRVPIMEGWWLFSGFLASLGLLIRGRRKKQ